MAECIYKIGTYKIAEDTTRINYAECPKYDKLVAVKAGEYPVVVHASDLTSRGSVSTCYLRFDSFSECWHGFIMAESEAFTPADGWTVKQESYVAFDGTPSTLFEIVKA